MPMCFASNRKIRKSVTCSSSSPKVLMWRPRSSQWRWLLSSLDLRELEAEDEAEDEAEEVTDMMTRYN